MKKKIAIIIVHYGSAKYTLALLESLHKQKKDNFKIYLVDNDLSNRFETKPNPSKYDYRYIKSKSNLGWARGANLGASYAIREGCNILCFLTCDTEVSGQSFVEKLTQPLNHRGIGATIPLVVFYDDPSRIWSAGGKLYKSIAFTKHNNYNHSATTKNFNKFPDFGGIGLTMQTKVYKQIGGWDFDYFLYYEDVDICYKVRKLNLKIKLIPAAVIKHRVTTPSKNVKEKLGSISSFHYGKSVFIFIKKNFNKLNTITAMFGQLFIRAPLFAIAMIRQRNFAAFRSYIHGSLSGIKEVLF